MQGTMRDRIQVLLKERGETLRSAAKAAEIPTSTLHDWAAGVSPTNFDAVMRLARHLQVPMSFLLCGVLEEGTDLKPEAIFSGSELLVDGYVRMRIERLIPRTPGVRVPKPRTNSTRRNQ